MVLNNKDVDCVNTLGLPHSTDYVSTEVTNEEEKKVPFLPDSEPPLFQLPSAFTLILWPCFQPWVRKTFFQCVVILNFQHYRSYLSIRGYSSAYRQCCYSQFKKIRTPTNHLLWLHFFLNDLYRNILPESLTLLLPSVALFLYAISDCSSWNSFEFTGKSQKLFSVFLYRNLEKSHIAFI